MKEKSMQTYDPNIQWATHDVEIMYQQWDYTCTAVVQVEGNCKGFSIMESAISMHVDKIFEDAQDMLEPTMVLKRPAEDGVGEDTLETSADCESVGRWLEAMCVGIRIVGHEPYKEKNK